jgi:hypothetical protein
MRTRTASLARLDGLKKELGKGFSIGLDGDYLTISTRATIAS